MKLSADAPHLDSLIVELRGLANKYPGLSGAEICYLIGASLLDGATEPTGLRVLRLVSQAEQSAIAEYARLTVETLEKLRQGGSA